MRKLYLLTFLTVTSNYCIYSQKNTNDHTNNLFYKVGIAATISSGENYHSEFDIPDERSGAPAFFIHNAIGVQFNRLTLIGLNLEYNKYPKQGGFLPLYISLQRNIIRNTNDIYLRGGYGTLLDVGRDFRNGRLFKAGVGCQIYYNKGKNSFLAGIDYTKKTLSEDIMKSLSGVAIYFEFILL